MNYILIWLVIGAAYGAIFGFVWKNVFLFGDNKRTNVWLCFVIPSVIVCLLVAVLGGLIFLISGLIIRIFLLLILAIVAPIIGAIASFLIACTAEERIEKPEKK